MSDGTSSLITHHTSHIMQTTEIFVEQLIIGLMALIAILLLAAPEAASLITKPDIGTGVLFLSGAYVAGILFDRYADSVLGDLEQHQRLLRALDELKELNGGKELPAKAPAYDLFPEGHLRIDLLRDEHVAPYGNYLRSRIRLMRALATLLPALAIGVALWNVDVDRHGAFGVLPWLVLVVYGGLFLASIPREKLPRTDKLHEGRNYEDYLALVTAKERGDAPHKAVLLARAPFAGLILTGVAVVLLLRAKAPHLIWFPIGAFLGSMVAGWAWWRITVTYHRLLLKL